MQLLEEMGLDENYRCPSCNEILIRKLKKTVLKDGRIILFQCTHCHLTFGLINCRICHKTKYSHSLNVCTECFKKARLSVLTEIMDKISREYNKRILIKARRKPDISLSITKQMYNKIALKSIDQKCSKADFEH